MYRKRSLQYIDEADLYFSCVTGKNIYCWNEELDNDPTDVSGERRCPLLMEVRTGKKYLAKNIRWNRYVDVYIKAVAARPDNRQGLLWPVDVVSLNGEKITDVYAEGYFGRHSEENGNRISSHVLLFECGDYEISRPVSGLLEEIKYKSAISWKEPKIQSLIMSILEAYRELNSEGYLNLDFDFNHIYMQNDGKILLAYSHLVVDEKKHRDLQLVKGEYPVEFAQPALVQGKTDNPDVRMQNYSLAAMLFHLMIGRSAYDGSMLLGFTDSNEDEHERKFVEYHRNPVFIFDEEDSSNHLGDLKADESVIELWEELPEQVRSYFIRTLCRASAERTKDLECPTPEEWMECLQNSAWQYS